MKHRSYQFHLLISDLANCLEAEDSEIYKYEL